MQSSKRISQDEALGEVEVTKRKKWQPVEHEGHTLLIIFAFFYPLVHHHVSSLPSRTPPPPNSGTGHYGILLSMLQVYASPVYF